MARNSAFRIPAALRRKRLTVAYIYNDGVIVGEEKRVKVGSQHSEVRIWHVFPYEFPRLMATKYNPDDSHDYVTKRWEVASIVVHHPEILFDGLQYMNISVSSVSPKMQELGILHNVQINYTTASGATHTTREWPFLSSATTTFFTEHSNPTQPFINPRKLGSIADIDDWKDHRDIVVQH